MDAGETTGTSRLTGMLTARVPSGFGDQVRAAARTRGEKPGAFIRRAIRDRIDGKDADMTREDFHAAVQMLLEGGPVHPDLKAAVQEFSAERLPRFKAELFEKLAAVHRHVGLFLQQSAALASADPAEGADTISRASSHELVAAFGAMEQAQELRDDLARLVVFGEHA